MRRISRAAATFLIRSLCYTMQCLPLICAVLVFGASADLAAATQDILVPMSCSFGNVCVLPCHGHNLSEIIWEFELMPVQFYSKSKTPLHQHHRLKNKTFLNNEALKGNCSLTIQDMNLQDKGIYKCTLKSQSGKEELLYYNISVHAPVEEVTIVLSGNLLICSSEQVYPEPKCQWSDAPSNSLVHRDHQGLYSTDCSTPLLENVPHQCTVSTPYSSKSATYTELPPITFLGTSMTLPCGSSSLLAKSVIWKFNNSDTIVNQSREVLEKWRPFVKGLSESGDISLKSLTSDHQGLFTCVRITDTETYTFNMRLEKKGFSNLTICAVFIIASVLTAGVLGAYKCRQETSEAQPSSPKSSSSAEPPPDRPHAVRFICGCLGLGSGLPWHLLVMGLLYFQHCGIFSDQNWIFSFIVLVSQLPQLPCLLVSSCLDPRFALRKHTTGCLVGITLLYVTLLVSAKVQIATEVFFVISMCALWMVSVFTNIVQHHLSVEVNLLPTNHKCSFALGQTIAGIISSLLMTFVAIAQDDDASVFWHFVIGIFVSLVTLCSYFLLPHQVFAKDNANQQIQMKEELLDMNDKKNNDPEHSQSPDNGVPNWTDKLCSSFCVMLVPLVTISVYPAITANIHTTYPGVWGRFFIPVSCFLIFNLIDLIGWKIPCVSRAHQHFLIAFPILVAVHTSFVPLFMFCNVQPRTFLYVYFSNDAAFIIIMFFFSLSNGFLTHLTMLYVPNSEDHSGNDRPKIIGTVLGSSIGALLSFAFRAAI